MATKSKFKIRELVERYRLSEASIYRLKKSGIDVQDPAAVAAELLRKRQANPETLRAVARAVSDSNSGKRNPWAEGWKIGQMPTI